MELLFVTMGHTLAVMSDIVIGGKTATQMGFKASEWLAATWMEITNGIAAAMRLAPEEKERLRASRTARIIGAIPFVAGCRQPERTALSHLATYLIAARDGYGRRIFDHGPGDDGSVYDRLKTGMGFEGGDERVIRHGMAILALNQLQGYETDQDKDRASGEYNPLVSGAWDFAAEREKLYDELTATPSGGLDEIVGNELMVIWN